jgi:hypothetical protein
MSAALTNDAVVNYDDVDVNYLGISNAHVQDSVSDDIQKVTSKTISTLIDLASNLMKTSVGTIKAAIMSEIKEDMRKMKDDIIGEVKKDMNDLKDVSKSLGNNIDQQK